MTCDLCKQERSELGAEQFGPYAFCGWCIDKEIVRSGKEWAQVLGRSPMYPLSRGAAARILAGRWFGYSVTAQERAQQAEDDRLFAEDHSWASDNQDLCHPVPTEENDYGTFRSEE